MITQFSFYQLSTPFYIATILLNANTIQMFINFDYFDNLFNAVIFQLAYVIHDLWRSYILLKTNF